MNLVFLIIVLWIAIAFFAGKRGANGSGRKSGTLGGGQIGQMSQTAERKDLIKGKRRGLNTETKPLRNTIPESGTIADWVNRSGMMGTQTSLSALEDRENDWLAREIRREKAIDNEFISEMKKLKLEHKRTHNRIHGN